MLNKGAVKDIHIKDCGIREVCETCLKGKMTRKSFPKKSMHQSKEILDLVHTDVCGPRQTIIPGKKPYLLTMIDDYSRYTIIYLMTNKSEVPSKIKEYIQLKINSAKYQKLLGQVKEKNMSIMNFKLYSKKKELRLNILSHNTSFNKSRD